MLCQVTGQLESAFPELAGLPLAMFVLVLVATCFRNRKKLVGLIDFVEFNAGVGHVTRSVLGLGFFAVAVDKVFNPTHNCSSAGGMQFWFEILLLVRKSGHVWYAPDCSTWVWISRHLWQCNGMLFW